MEARFGLRSSPQAAPKLILFPLPQQVGNLLFGFGLYLVRRHFLNYSWRKMLLITSIGLNLVDMPFVFCTVSPRSPLHLPHS